MAEGDTLLAGTLHTMWFGYTIASLQQDLNDLVVVSVSSQHQRSHVRCEGI